MERNTREFSGGFGTRSQHWQQQTDTNDIPQCLCVDMQEEESLTTSTYKFKTLFRHGPRTAPKFDTHVRIQTRLSLNKKN